MPETKKGKRYGGRAKGTPNKVTADMRATKDRLMVAEKLMQYAIPKLQATTIDVSENAQKTIEDTLLELSQLPPS